jgi:hypothetical protein
MKQIKTIKNRLDNAASFDKEVNAALAEGWQLTKREVLQPKAQSESLQAYTMLYAELEREEITEAERCCENCAHYDTVSHNPPCCDCSEDANKWEPVT